MEKGRVIVISGASGVGKNKIIEKFINNPELNLAQAISMTTRAKRENERDGITYDFVTQDYFEEAIRKGDLIEYMEFLGNYYGTEASSVEHILALGKNVLLEVEPSGAKQIQAKYPNSISIFIVPSSLTRLEEVIRERRQESEEIVQERLAKAKKELDLISTYRYVVNNDDQELAAQLCTVIIKNYINKAEKKEK